MTINTVAVIGSGVMGSGLALCLSLTGHTVLLVDSSEDVLAKTQKLFVREARRSILLGGSEFEGEPVEALNRVVFSQDLEIVRDAGYVIESVSEHLETKRELFSLLDRIAPADCIFASNTSAIPIAQLAAATGRPELVVGIHFMNPVPLKSTVELISGSATSGETINTTRQLLQAMGKRWVEVRDSAGFVSNRVLMLSINEAIQLLAEQVADPSDIDTVFTACLGHTMGPLETADLIGLDTVLLSLRVLQDTIDQDKFRPAPLLEDMVRCGRTGRKSGRGFFIYPA